MTNRPFEFCLVSFGFLQPISLHLLRFFWGLVDYLRRDYHLVVGTDVQMQQIHHFLSSKRHIGSLYKRVLL